MNNVYKVLGWIWTAVLWSYRRSLGAYVGYMRSSPDFRRGAAATVAMLVCVGALSVGVHKTVTKVKNLVTKIDLSEPISPDEPEYVQKVRLARDKIAGFDRDILPYVLEEYNTYVSNPEWLDYAQRCLQHAKEFKRAEKLTLYPWIMTAGMALHESKCNWRAKSYDNGRGLMQITNFDPKHAKVARGLLSVKKVDFVGEPYHNIVLGIVIHDDYERRLGSREHGTLAFNRGVGGTRADMRKCGRKSGDPLFSVTAIRPCLQFKQNGAKPRTYVPRVLATIVIMNRLVNDQPLVKLDRIRESDIPGWDPSDDGDTSWFASLW
ncbi:transglycosylase SLT domain-containing protein [Candidatus Uhrbacteria bacterium]|nr:transglycosylase SLT domain-containing protein [Candidatus Uhrbacteria bacterium]